MTIKPTFVIKVVRVPFSADEEAIEDWLEAEGIDAHGVRLWKQKRAAFVILTSPDDVEKALQIKKPLETRKVFVFKSSMVEMEESLNPPNECVHLRNLSLTVTKSDIDHYFRPLPLGENGIFLCLDKRGRQQGEGYVQFADENTAAQAVARDKGILLDRQVIVTSTNLKLMKIAQDVSLNADLCGFKKYKKTDLPEGGLVKLTGLPSTVTEDRIKQWFRGDGLVPEDVFILDQAKKKKGASDQEMRAFVRFPSVEDLKKALQKDRKFMDVNIIMCVVPSWKLANTLKVLKLQDAVVHVAGLPLSCQQAHIHKLFKGLEVATNGIYIYQIPKRKNFLCAFVQFTETKSAVKALTKNNKSWDGRRIYVQRSSLKRKKAMQAYVTKEKMEMPSKQAEAESSKVPDSKKQKRKNKKLQKSDQNQVEEMTSKILENSENSKRLVNGKTDKFLTPVTSKTVDSFETEPALNNSSLNRKRKHRTETLTSLPSTTTQETQSSPKKKRRSNAKTPEPSVLEVDSPSVTPAAARKESKKRRSGLSFTETPILKQTPSVSTPLKKTPVPTSGKMSSSKKFIETPAKYEKKLTSSLKKLTPGISSTKKRRSNVRFSDVPQLFG